VKNWNGELGRWCKKEPLSAVDQGGECKLDIMGCVKHRSTRVALEKQRTNEKAPNWVLSRGLAMASRGMASAQDARAGVRRSPLRFAHPEGQIHLPRLGLAR
jgi:hypothetical protein